MTEQLYEEGAIQDVQGGRNDGRCSSLTVLDNILTVGESVGAKRELAGLTLAQEAS